MKVRFAVMISVLLCHCICVFFLCIPHIPAIDIYWNMACLYTLWERLVSGASDAHLDIADSHRSESIRTICVLRYDRVQRIPVLIITSALVSLLPHPRLARSMCVGNQASHDITININGQVSSLYQPLHQVRVLTSHYRLILLQLSIRQMTQILLRPAAHDQIQLQPSTLLRPIQQLLLTACAGEERLRGRRGRGDVTVCCCDGDEMTGEDEGKGTCN